MTVKPFFVIYLTYVYGSKALSVEDRFLQVEETLKQQQITLELHEKTIRDQAITINNQKKENDIFKMRLEELENEIRRYKDIERAATEDTSGYNAESNIQSRGRNIKEENASLNNFRQKQQRTADSIQSTSQHLKRFVENVQVNGIAFHAYLTGRKCVNNQEVIVFDTEVIDDGNGYSHTDGIYVVPESGTYVFTWTVFSDFNEYFRADIIIDGTSRGKVIADSDNDQATGFIIAKVNIGVHVFISRDQGKGCTIHDSLARSTFTGWKLF